MKKFILSLLLVLSTSIVFSQTYYKAKITELHVYNKSTDQWQLSDKNSDVSITVVVEDHCTLYTLPLMPPGEAHLPVVG